MMTDQELAGPYKVNPTQIFGHPDGRARCSIEGFPLELLVKAEDANSVCDLLNIAHERGKIASREADRKEIERLTAIVEKLPRTADGVPLLLSDFVNTGSYWYDNRDGSMGLRWDDHPEMNLRKGPLEIIEVHVCALATLGNCHQDSREIRLVGLLRPGHSVSTCGRRERLYSTRELAQAAFTTPKEA